MWAIRFSPSGASEEAVPDFMADGNEFFWLDLSPAELSGWAGRLGLHPLTVAGTAETERRSKVREYGDGFVFIALNAPAEEEGGNADPELTILIGPRHLLTVHGGEISFLNDVRKAVRRAPPLSGPAHLLYLLLDRLVDGYFPLLDRWNDELTEAEGEIFVRPRNEHLSQLLSLKKRVLALRRTLVAQREILTFLVRRGRFPGDTRVHHYFTDVYDHLILAVEMVDNLREVISSTLEGYLSVVSNRLNEIMKTLTLIATIGLPLSVITGIYGMNFHIPETEWPFGYAYAWALMLVVSGGMLLYFRWRRWM